MNTKHPKVGHITEADGNVFADLGLPEAANLRVRSQLMIALKSYIKERGLTQEEAAEQMGVTQPRISDLTRGKIDLFSIDMLVNMLDRVHLRVDLEIKQPA